MADASLTEREVKRVLRLPSNADPFMVLGIEIFRPAEKISGDGASGGEKTISGKGGGAPSPSVLPELLPVTLADVKKAYRKLTVLLHPDKVESTSASASVKASAVDAFHLVDTAYKKLPSEAVVERFKIQLQRQRARQDAETRRRAEVAKNREKNGAGSSADADFYDADRVESRVTQAWAAFEQQKKAQEIRKAEERAANEQRKRAREVIEKREEEEMKRHKNVLNDLGI